MTPRFELSGSAPSDCPLLIASWEDAVTDPQSVLAARAPGHDVWIERVLAINAPKTKEWVSLLWPSEAPRTVLYGMGKKSKAKVYKLRLAIRSLTKAIGQRKYDTIAIAAGSFLCAGLTLPQVVRLLQTEIALAAYDYTELKRIDPEDPPVVTLDRVIFVTGQAADPALQEQVERGNAVAGGLTWTRNLANRPA
ncbi:MAG: M17 family peptidase N-terminal domain-containing protein, partial [bacterium]